MYRNRKDKPSHKPRLVSVYGVWHCYTHNATGAGHTQQQAYYAWQRGACRYTPKGKQ